MTRNNIVMVGLPQSGKTTFLAALWHLVTSAEIDTALRFHSLQKGDYTHLNTISKRWREAKPQLRTDLRSSRFVQMNLVDTRGREAKVSFPDLSGEVYRMMWETRQCTSDICVWLEEASALLLFVHANTLKYPLWVIDEREQMAELGLEVTEDDDLGVQWQPAASPTQVKLVDIVQLIQEAPLNCSPRKIAVALSAWDEVMEDERKPGEFFGTELPLLSQYVFSVFGLERARVYGVSAQGADYKTMASVLLARDVPSERVIVVDPDGKRSSDLTELLDWLVC